MRGARRVAGAIAIATLAAGAGCEAVHGLHDAGPGGEIDGGGVTIDAGTGTPDAAPPEPGPIKVAVYDRYGAPQSGVPVVFHDADGVLIAVVETTAGGIAEHEMPPWSAITVARTHGDETQTTHTLETILGAMPGDRIEVGPRVPEPQGLPMGEVTFDFAEGWGGSESFEVRIGCDGASFSGIDSFAYQFWENTCNGAQRMTDLLFVVRDPGTWEPLAYDVHFDFEFTPGAYVTAGNWSDAWRTLDINLSNPPPGVFDTDIRTQVLRRGLDYGIDSPPSPSLDPGATTRVPIRMPPDFADALHPSVQLFFGGSSGITGIQMLAGAIGPMRSSFDVDLSADLLPPVLDVSIIDYDDRTTADFTIGGDVDDSVSALAWIRSWRDDSDPKRIIDWQWTLLADPGLGPPLEMGNIPTDILLDPLTFESAWPPPTTSVAGQQLAAVVAAPEGWDELRQQRGFGVFEEPLAFDTPAGARVRISAAGLFGDK